jgi:hypothetical protein
MALQRCGKIVSLTFERQRAMVDASNWEAVQPKLKHSEGNPQCLLNNLDSSHGGGGPP